MTTITLADYRLSPNIVLARSDHRHLVGLAAAGLGDETSIADELLYELERARVVADSELPPDVVRMGSRVRFRTSGQAERSGVLVYPVEADISSGRISVLTPVGTALIGLRAGQSITFSARDGRSQVLTVLAVDPPESDDGPRAA